MRCVCVRFLEYGTVIYGCSFKEAGFNKGIFLDVNDKGVSRVENTYCSHKESHMEYSCILHFVINMVDMDNIGVTFHKFH